jgi:hypothetical protein
LYINLGLDSVKYPIVLQYHGLPDHGHRL